MEKLLKEFTLDATILKQYPTVIEAMFTKLGKAVPDNLVVEEEPELRNRDGHEQGRAEPAGDQHIDIDQRESAKRIEELKHNTGSQSRSRINAEVLSRGSSHR